MNLTLPVIVTDELEEKVIRANATLNLTTGSIDQLAYLKYDVQAEGPPWKRKDYEFTNGKISSNGRDIEFTVTVDKIKGTYSVMAAELDELKTRMASN